MSRHYSPLVAAMKTSQIAGSVASDLDLTIGNTKTILGINLSTEWAAAAGNVTELQQLIAQAEDIAARLRVISSNARTELKIMNPRGE